MADIVGLDKAIADAAAELTKESDGSSSDKSTEKKPTETKEETPEDSEDEGTEEESEEESSDSESDDEEMSEEETKESKALYKLLKDPKTRTSVLAALASEAGLLPSHKEGEKTTKKEEAAAKKGVQEILEEALGSEYEFLAGRLSKGIDKVLEQEREEHESKIQEIHRTNVEKEVAAEYNRLARETKGDSRKLENRMAELSSEIPVGKMDVRTYIKRLYTIAAGEKAAAPRKTADQIRKNASDVSSRLKSGASPLSKLTIPDKKMSLDESVKWAQQELLKQGNK